MRPLPALIPWRTDDFRAIFERCDNATLRQLAQAGIRFVSNLAVNACTRRGIEV